MVTLPLELFTRAAPSTPDRVMPPEDADTVTSPLPDWVMVMLPEPLLAFVGPATAAAVMEPLPVLASRLAAPSTLMLPDPVDASTAPPTRPTVTLPEPLFTAAGPAIAPTTMLPEPVWAASFVSAGTVIS